MRGDYEELYPERDYREERDFSELGRTGWDWTLLLVLGLTALFVWILMDAGCARGSEPPPQAPPVQAPPVKRETVKPPAAGGGVATDGGRPGAVAPPPVIIPRVTVYRAGTHVEVYGFLPDGRRLGFYLPADATAADIDAKAKELESHLDASRPAEVRPAVPFGRPTPVRSAGVPSTESPAPDPPWGLTPTGARLGIFGSTNCSPFG